MTTASSALWTTTPCPQARRSSTPPGAYVAPGLIDVHIHGYLGQDVCDCNPDGIRKIAAGIVQNGVTGFLPDDDDRVDGHDRKGHRRLPQPEGRV